MNTRAYALLLSSLLFLSPGISAQELSVNGFITQGFFYTDSNNIYGKSSDGSFDFRKLR